MVIKFFEINVHAGVHDLFWTRACDVEKMSQILKDKFVELYSMPIIENVNFFCIMKNFGLFYRNLWREVISCFLIMKY